MTDIKLIMNYFLKNLVGDKINYKTYFLVNVNTILYGICFVVLPFLA
jgi:hypothetical protein